jgi:Flp pilus assembly pilin Flp
MMAKLQAFESPAFVRSAAGKTAAGWRALRRFWRETSAVTSVEYAMLLACILAVALVAVKTLGEKNYALWIMNNYYLKEVHFGE